MTAARKRFGKVLAARVLQGGPPCTFDGIVRRQRCVERGPASRSEVVGSMQLFRCQAMRQQTPHAHRDRR